MSPTLEIEHSGYCLKICKRGEPCGISCYTREDAMLIHEGRKLQNHTEDWGVEALALGSYFGISFYLPCSIVIQQT